jgi:hypothetical protein
MSASWKIFVRDRDNLRELLNLLVVNRETVLTIRRGEGLTLFVEDIGKEKEVIQYIRQELGNKVERSGVTFKRRENVFLFNKPKYQFNSIFPFLIETALFSIKGDTIFFRAERYSTVNPFKTRRLGQKAKKVLYRISINTPLLLRDYSTGGGVQALTLGKGYPLILTSFEVSSLINGGGE